MHGLRPTELFCDSSICGRPRSNVSEEAGASGISRGEAPNAELPARHSRDVTSDVDDDDDAGGSSSNFSDSSGPCFQVYKKISQLRSRLFPAVFPIHILHIGTKSYVCIKGKIIIK